MRFVAPVLLYGEKTLTFEEITVENMRVSQRAKKYAETDDKG